MTVVLMSKFDEKGGENLIIKLLILICQVLRAPIEKIHTYRKTLTFFDL